MADYVTEDGRAINFDLNKISIREYRALFDRNQPDDDEYRTLAKVTGISAKEIGDLPFLEWRRLYLAFIERCAQPLSDPNSVSAST
jgi:hypothetical protein